jgi:hypothetical protein
MLIDDFVLLRLSFGKTNSCILCFDIKCLRKVDVDPLFVDICLLSGHKRHVEYFELGQRMAYCHTCDECDTAVSFVIAGKTFLKFLFFLLDLDLCSCCADD